MVAVLLMIPIPIGPSAIDIEVASAATTAETEILTPRANRVLKAGPLGVTGRYAASGSGSAAVVYVIDLSGSTTSQAGDGDCSGDNQVDSSDDPNGDGAAGTVLDCEIIGLSTLATQVAGRAPSAPTAVIGFGSIAEIADVDSAAGFPEEHKVVAAGYDGPDGEEHDVRDRVQDAINVLAGAQHGQLSIFTPLNVGGSTSFVDAIARVAEVFSLSEFNATNKLVFFVSDGQSFIADNDPSLEAVHRNGTVFSYGVGSGTDGCAAGAPLAIIAGEEDRCTVVEDPTDLQVELGMTSAAVEVSLFANGNPVAGPLMAPVTAFGDWEVTFPSVPAGRYQIVATGPEGPEARRSVTVIEGPDAISYVALGDSYSSGEGEDPWRNQVPAISKSDLFDDECHRSPKGYPMQVASEAGGPPFASAPVSQDFFTFAACSGAIIRDVLQQEKFDGMGRQIDYLGPDVDLVTLTIGGNDLEFAQIFEHCFWQAHCFDDGFVKFNSGTDLTLAEYVEVRLALLTAQLPPTYRAVQEAAPNSQVIVAGYPDLVHPNPQIFCRSRIGIGGEERTFIVEGNGKLDALLAAAASRSDVTFKSVRDDFRPHLQCGPDTPEYLHSHTYYDTKARLHPTAAGYTRYAQLISGEVDISSTSVRTERVQAARPALVRVQAGEMTKTVLGGAELDGVAVNSDGTVAFAPWISEILGDIPTIRVSDAEQLLAGDIASALSLSVADDSLPACDSVSPGQQVSGSASGFAPGSAVTQTISGPDGEYSTSRSLIADAGGLVDVSFTAPDIGTDTMLQVVVEGVDTTGMTHWASGMLLVPGVENTCSDGLSPVSQPFSFAAKTATSRLVAEGTPTSQGIDGKVYGYLEEEKTTALPISSAGLTTGPGGEELLIVNFSASEEEWILRFTKTTPTTGTVELCGPDGCVPGFGADLLTMSAEQRAATEQSFGVGPPPTSMATTSPTSINTTTTTNGSTTTTSTIAPATTTASPPPATSAPTTQTSSSDRCRELRRQYDEAGFHFVKRIIANTMRDAGCPVP